MCQAKAVSSEMEKEMTYDVEEPERPRPTSTRSLLTLKPLPKIDPKDKGKKKIEEEDESDIEYEDIPEAEKKFKQLARLDRVDRKLQEDWETKEERKRLAKEEPTKTALSDEYDFIQARIEVDRLLALRLQDEREREQFIKVKRFNESFTAVGSTEDERRIKEINEGVKGHYVDNDDENRKCLRIVTFEDTIDSEIMEKKSFIAMLNKVSSPDGEYLVIYRANENFRAFNYLMEGDLKIMMESYEENDHSDFWSNNGLEDCHLQIVEACGCLHTELKMGQVFNSPCFMVKSWLVQDQTVLGKDYSNLLIADSLLKTIWFINAPCYGNEALASPKANELTIPEQVKSWLVQDQTVLGKDYSNLLIADSLLKTIWFINAPCYGNEALASPKANGIWKYSSLALEDQSLDHLETKLYD
ncbi:hypothetical protein Tco_1577216 [Tanacetum coccineum]